MAKDPGASIRADELKHLRVENEDLKKKISILIDNLNKLQAAYDKMCETVIQKASLFNEVLKGK